MILPIYTYGQPVLREVAEEIAPDYPELQQLIDDMFITMDKSDGVGLAAPQIGLSIRLVVIDLTPLAEDDERFKDYRKVLINPYIEEFYEEEQDVMDEGCLSLPGISESVKRPTKIRISYQDVNFEEHEEIVEGFAARCMQHELDHLEGVLFVDRIAPLRKTMIKNKLAQMAKGKVRTHYKVKPIRGRR